MQTEAEIKQLQERERTAQAYAKHPALLRMLEFETLRDLGENANARINSNYVELVETNLATYDFPHVQF